jgi:ABC-type phosphate transport system substrate-binding protein
VLLSVWLALTCLAQAKQLAVVVEKDNPVGNLTAAELAKIFTGHTRAWPDGKPIKVVMRDPSSADMQIVVRKLFNMSPDQVQAFIQTHRGEVMIADSDDAVIRFVSSTRGAIAIVDLYSLTKDVNVVKVDGKLPVEQGYFLRGN